METPSRRETLAPARDGVNRVPRLSGGPARVRLLAGDACDVVESPSELDSQGIDIEQHVAEFVQQDVACFLGDAREVAAGVPVHVLRLVGDLAGVADEAERIVPRLEWIGGAVDAHLA